MIETVSSWLQSVPLDSALWVLVLVFIVLDVVAGTVKAIITKTVSSEIARKGVMHKMGYILAMLMCTLIDIAQTITDLEYTVPLLKLCTGMICTAEIFSLCEHIKELNPDIKLNFLNSKDEK